MTPEERQAFESHLGDGPKLTEAELFRASQYREEFRQSLSVIPEWQPHDEEAEIDRIRAFVTESLRCSLPSPDVRKQALLLAEIDSLRRQLAEAMRIKP